MSRLRAKKKAEKGFSRLRSVRPLGAQVDTELYFEIKLVQCSETKAPLLGIGFSTVDTAVNDFKGHIGWRKGTVGWHGDKGCLYFEKGTGGINIGPKWAKGDVVGCGWNPASSEVYFTHQGTMLEHKVDISKWGNNVALFPYVSSHQLGAVFEIAAGKRLSEAEGYTSQPKPASDLP